MSDIYLSMTQVVTVRMTEEDAVILEELCDLRGEDRSSFVRRVVKMEFVRLGYSTFEASKALGMTTLNSNYDGVKNG